LIKNSVMKNDVYDWQIYNFTGEVKAKDMPSAIIKVVKTHLKNVPYLSDEISRMDIIVQKRKK